jgi:hypothetical protein
MGSFRTHPAAQLIADNLPRLQHRGNNTRYGLAGLGAESLAPYRLGIAEAILQLLEDNDMPVPLPGQATVHPADPPHSTEIHPFIQQVLRDAAEKQAQK